MKILGISAYYHDSAAALLEDGVVIAAAQEERFSRIKHDDAFPTNAISYCLQEAGLEIGALDAVVFYDKPFLKFERLLQTYMDNVPAGLLQFIGSMPAWLKQKLFIKSQLKDALAEIGDIDWKETDLLFSKHHLSHAASSFFTSNHKEAAILTIDGVGEWATASIAKGKENKIENLKELHFPNSLGLLYSAVTYFLGFKVNSGEYKVMGLAPYASEEDALVSTYREKIKKEIVSINADGSILLNQAYFKYATSFKMIKEAKFERLFGFAKREEEGLIEEKHYCMAKALQLVTEEIVLAMATHAKELTGLNTICLAGGVALNCVANGKLQDANLFENIYIQPAAGDAGNALGAAFAAYYMHYNAPRVCKETFDNMQWSRLGPVFSEKEISREIKNYKLQATRLEDTVLLDFCAEQLMQGGNIGWFQGRMEFGPRALGGRSILGNPLLKETQSALNVKVKQRESFRPFAPIMLEAEFEKYFGKKHPSPYMLFVHKLLPEFRKEIKGNGGSLITKINQERSTLPAITHIDYSARIQTVNEQSDLLLFQLLNKFKSKSGVGVLVNTSFNLRGAPIVCAPKDAIETFLSTDLDLLVLGNYVIKRTDNIDLLQQYIATKLD